MTARSGRPRAVGGQSRWHSVAPDPDQSHPRPWRLHIHDGSERRLHDPPLKCSDSSRRPTSILKTAFFKKAVNSEVFFLERFCPPRGGHGTLLKCSDSSWRLLWWGPLISKTFSWGLCGHLRRPREGEKAPCSLLRSALVTRHRITAFCNGLCRPVPSYTINMQRFAPSHGAL